MEGIMSRYFMYTAVCFIRVLDGGRWLKWVAAMVRGTKQVENHWTSTLRLDAMYGKHEAHDVHGKYGQNRMKFPSTSCEQMKPDNYLE